jgi:hypothetical protein
MEIPDDISNEKITFNGRRVYGTDEERRFIEYCLPKPTATSSSLAVSTPSPTKAPALEVLPPLEIPELAEAEVPAPRRTSLELQLPSPLHSFDDAGFGGNDSGGFSSFNCFSPTPRGSTRQDDDDFNLSCDEPPMSVAEENPALPCICCTDNPAHAPWHNILTKTVCEHIQVRFGSECLPTFVCLRYALHPDASRMFPGMFT